MNITMLTRVRRHYNCPMAPRHINRSNQRKWVKSVRQLGTNWLLHPANNTKKVGK